MITDLNLGIMKRRDFLNIMTLSPMTMRLWGSAGEPRGETKRPPNIVVIMADDLSPEVLGCYGSKAARTPNIDKLAQEGVIFTTCWATPICSPSRAMMMTGRYAHRTGWYHNGLRIPGPGNSRDFKTHHLTFSHVLKRCGYAAAVAGRWQLPKKPDSPGSGFDESCVWDPKQIPFPQKSKFTGLRVNKKSRSKYWHPALVRNETMLPTTVNDFGPDICTDFLIDFIKRSQHKPFLVYYPMILPHQIGEDFPVTPASGKPAALSGGSLQESCNYIDILVGRIIRCLDQLGLRENTLVIFTADNPIRNKNKATGKGARVPLVVNGPGLVKKRPRSGELVSLADIFPTLVDAAGAGLPGGYEIDGKSLAPYLAGETHRHREWIYSYIGTARMLRDKHWVLEAVDPVCGNPGGRFYRCVNNEKGGKYEEVTHSRDPQVLEARKRFDMILEKIPHLDFKHPAAKEILGKYSNYKYRHKLK